MSAARSYRQAALFFGAGYVGLALAVGTGWPRPLDISLSTAARLGSPCWALNISEAASLLLAGEMSLLYVGAMALLCVLRGRPHAGFWLVLLLLSTVGLELAFKFSFYQPGPDALLGELERPDCYEPDFLEYPLARIVVPNTFPSGYAARAAYLGLLLIALLGARWPNLTRPARLWLLPALALLGGTRVAIGWHWTSDVLAGLLLGAAAACVALTLADGFRWLRAVEPTARSPA